MKVTRCGRFCVTRSFLGVNEVTERTNMKPQSINRTVCHPESLDNNYINRTTSTKNDHFTFIALEGGSFYHLKLPLSCGFRFHLIFQLKPRLEKSVDTHELLC